MKSTRRKKRKPIHVEKSTVLAALCFLLGGGSIVAYWAAVFMDKSPDSSVAVQSLITVIGAVLSYCLYQFGLKNSRNKYGVDADGQPFKTES